MTIDHPDHMAERDANDTARTLGAGLGVDELTVTSGVIDLAPPAKRSVIAPPRRRRVIDEPAPSAAPSPISAPVGWGPIIAGSLLASLVLVPLVVLAVRAGATEWIPGGDRAVIELHVRDVGSHTPLIGPYSRYGWSHPGPLSYWTLAIPYRVLGSTSSALLAATALVNLVSAIGTMAILWRRGRLPLLALGALALSLLCRALVPANLIDPWNPYMTVLPLLLFVALAWTMREGDRWAAPTAALVGSFLVQSHVGYAGIVSLVLMWAALGWVRDRLMASQDRGNEAGLIRRLLRAARPGPTFAVSVVVLTLCWAPVLVDQVAGSRNLTQVANYFSRSTDEPAGLPFALGVVTRQITGLPLGEAKTRPVWLGGDQPVSPHGGGEVPVNPFWLGLAASAFFVLSVAVRRTAQRAPTAEGRLQASGALRLQILVGLCAAAGIISVARVTGVVYNYLILWWQVLAMLAWLSAGWSIWCVATAAITRCRQRPPRALGVLRAAMTVGAALLAIWSAQVFMLQIFDSRPPEEYHRDPVTALSGPAIAATPLGGPVLVDSAGGGPTNMTDGIRLQLERANRPTVSKPEDAYKLGAHRDSTKSRPVTEVWVVSGEAIVEWAKRDDVRQVAIWDPVPSPSRARYFEDVEVLRNQILAAHRMDLFDALYSNGSLIDAYGHRGIDQDVLRRVDDVRAKGRPLAIFVGSAPVG